MRAKPQPAFFAAQVCGATMHEVPWNTAEKFELMPARLPIRKKAAQVLLSERQIGSSHDRFCHAKFRKLITYRLHGFQRCGTIVGNPSIWLLSWEHPASFVVYQNLLYMLHS